MTHANFALVYSYFVPLEAIRGTQARAPNVGLVISWVVVPVTGDLAIMMKMENEVRQDVPIEVCLSALEVGRRVDRPKSV